jgi:dihydrodipicolinate synthase/N-acetylneuraminate lyase
VRHILDGGVHGVFAMGGTGNFCSFTAEERFEVARTVVQEVKGKVPVIVGGMDSSTRLVVRNARMAAEAGADAVVVEPPFYYPCTEEDVLSHYRAVAEAAQVPVVIYNIPEANKVDIDVQLTKKLADISGIVGIKDSTSDFVYFQELLAAFSDPGFRLIQGQETLAGPSFLLGAHGAILAIGNVIPRLCVELFEAGSAGKLKETSELQTRLVSVFEICKQGGDDTISPDYYKETVASFFTGLHCALDILGLCKRVVTVPFPTPSPAQYERVRGILAQTGVLGATS